MDNAYSTIASELLPAVAQERNNVLGVGISSINMKDALELTETSLANNGKGYICVTGVHGVIEAQTDAVFRGILNRSFLTVPDGMPMVWIGWLRGLSRM